MTLFLIAPLIFSGYVFCHFNEWQYLKLEKRHGQYLYLTFFAFGFLFFGIASAIILTLHNFVPSTFIVSKTQYEWIIFSFLQKILSPFTAKSYSTESTALTTLISLLSIALSYICAKAFNFIDNHKFGSYKTHIYIQRQIDSDVSQRILFEACISRRNILITLDTGKVYVGRLLTFDAYDADSPNFFDSIQITPLLSGYRTAKKHRVKFTTNYDPNEIPQDFMVSIKKENIVSLSHFSFQSYHKLQNTEPSHNH